MKYVDGIPPRFNRQVWVHGSPTRLKVSQIERNIPPAFNKNSPRTRKHRRHLQRTFRRTPHFTLIRKDGQKHVRLMIHYCSASRRFCFMRRHDPWYPVQKLVRQTPFKSHIRQHVRPCTVIHFWATRQTNRTVHSST